MFSSRHIDDALVGTWKTYSSPIPLSDGDRLYINVIDRDFIDHDEMGTFSFTLDELLAEGDNPQPMANGHVQRLLLGPVKTWTAKVSPSEE